MEAARKIPRKAPRSSGSKLTMKTKDPVRKDKDMRLQARGDEIELTEQRQS